MSDPALRERLYRVRGRYSASDSVQTWAYKSKRLAQWRAENVVELVEFSYADVVWRPVPALGLPQTIGDRAWAVIRGSGSSEERP